MMNGKGVVRRNREVSELSLDESTGHFPNHGAGRGSWCRVLAFDSDMSNTLAR
jgi:hypothetical protein